MQNIPNTVTENGNPNSTVSSAGYQYDDVGNITLETSYDNLGQELIAKETTYTPVDAFAKELQIRDRPLKQVKKTQGKVPAILRWKEFGYDAKGNPPKRNFLSMGPEKNF